MRTRRVVHNSSLMIQASPPVIILFHIEKDAVEIISAAPFLKGEKILILVSIQ